MLAELRGVLARSLCERPFTFSFLNEGSFILQALSPFVKGFGKLSDNLLFPLLERSE
jgi:hypothetical protein